MDLLTSTDADRDELAPPGAALGDSAPAQVARMPPEPEDGALMQRYRNGDMRAFEILYARHKGALYRYLQRMCRNRETCNDLFQEVWSKIVTSKERYEPRAKFTTFLFHIAHNCAVDHFRRASRRHDGRTDDVDELQDRLPGFEADRPESKASEAQLQAAFARELARLPDEQRQVFVLREETGMTLEEIGTATGVTMETAKSRLRYALGKLRTALKQFDPQSSAQTTLGGRS